MLGCVEMLAMIYKNCGLHAVIGERLKKVSKCFSCKIFTDVSVRISPIQKPRRRKIRQESRRQLQSLHRGLSSQLSNIFKFFLYLAVRWNFLSLSSTSLLVGVDRVSFPEYFHIFSISRGFMKFSESFATSNLRGSWSSQFWNIFKFFLYLAVRWNFVRL